jgi:hypothetical protein
MDELLHERGLRRYGVFGVTTEGKRLPGGSETASGFVVDRGSRVYFFWLDWDREQERPVFSEWQEVAPDPEWETDEEYRAARQAAGLR